jgi:hypothetical protein
MLALAGPAAALAQSSQACPWLNAGTAAKILGAEVAVTAHSDSNWSGSCRFVTSTAPAASIEILIGKTDTHPCGDGATPLTAIGNHAVLCSSQDASHRDVQTVAGRVRDVWFVVMLATPSAPAEPVRSPSEPAMPPAIELLAEQVSGNLY